MTSKFVGETIVCVRWRPPANAILEDTGQCITVSHSSTKQSVALWDCGKEKISRLAVACLDDRPSCLGVVNHKTFVVGYEDNSESSLQVWGIGAGNELNRTTELQTPNSRTTQISTSEKLVASVGEEGFLQVHTVQGRSVYGAKSGMCLNACSQYLGHSVLVGSSAGQLHSYDTRQSGEAGPAATMSSDLVSILGIAVHPTQPSIVANSRSDGSILIWDLRSGSFPLATFAGHASAIWEVQFEPDRADNLYTCSQDGQLLLWNGAALSGVGGLLGGGGKVSPWLTPEISHQKMDVYNLLGCDNKLSVNSFHVRRGRVVCGGTRQTLFSVENCEE